MKRSVLIIAATLDYGGAEVTCVELARSLRSDYRVEVVALLNDGPAADEIRAAGIPVSALSANNPWRKMATCWRLARLIKTRKPDFVITFLYLSDLIGGLLARVLAPKTRVFWNIRNNVLNRSQMGLYTYVAYKLGAMLSRQIPHAIVYCSPLAKSQHEAIGYHCARSTVVENSAAAVPFSFSAEGRAAFRAGRFERDFVFLFVGTYTQIKRVDLFIDACARTFRLAGGNLRFVIAGRTCSLETHNFCGRSRPREFRSDSHSWAMCPIGRVFTAAPIASSLPRKARAVRMSCSRRSRPICP